MTTDEHAQWKLDQIIARLDKLIMYASTVVSDRAPVRVGQRTYETVSQAIAEHASGATLYLGPGTHYVEFGDVFNQRYEFIGAHRDLTRLIVVDDERKNTASIKTLSNITLRDITLEGSKERSL